VSQPASSSSTRRPQERSGLSGARAVLTPEQTKRSAAQSGSQRLQAQRGSALPARHNTASYDGARYPPDARSACLA
jgi:hypothetical protein